MVEEILGHDEQESEDIPGSGEQLDDCFDVVVQCLPHMISQGEQ